MLQRLAVLHGLPKRRGKVRQQRIRANEPPQRCAACDLQGEGGGLLLIIDAKGEGAANWWAPYGAEPLKDKPPTLVMPLITFAADLRAKGLH